jgi:hypothetical protein
MQYHQDFELPDAWTWFRKPVRAQTINSVSFRPTAEEGRLRGTDKRKKQKDPCMLVAALEDARHVFPLLLSIWAAPGDH